MGRRRGEPSFIGPVTLMEGRLKITDPVLFGDLLKRGIGRHRAYGYGMIVLAP